MTLSEDGITFESRVESINAVNKNKCDYANKLSSVIQDSNGLQSTNSFAILS